MKKFLCLFISIAFTMGLRAQVSSDALRYSSVSPYGGTARALGVGGTMGSIGGDFSAISTNPAGLATYRNGELVFTPGFHTAKTQSELLNGGTTSPKTTKNNFSVDNIGLVFANSRQNRDWKTVNFAIGYNRFTDFNTDVFYEGTTKGSFTARWRDRANLDNTFVDKDQFEGILAADAGAIYTKTVNGRKIWTTDFDQNPSTGIYKSEFIENAGGMGEVVVALAGNYKEKIQIGVTAGIPTVSFTENKIYKEVDKDGKIPAFNSMQYDQKLLTTGAGINAKIGIIFRPTQAIRLGATVHTPTAFRLSDNFTTSLVYDYTDSTRHNALQESPEGETSYTLNTPWRFIGSAGLIIGKSGFINADVEYVDYSQANFKLSKEDITYQNEVNTTITDRYKPAMNIRIGGEYVYDIFRFRAGVGLNNSPRQDKDFTNTTYNAGIGIRGKFFFMDLGWQKRQFKENYIPYKVVESQANTEQQVTNSYNLNNFLLTFGVKF
jgi:hypothetical protein